MNSTTTTTNTSPASVGGALPWASQQSPLNENGSVNLMEINRLSHLRPRQGKDNVPTLNTLQQEANTPRTHKGRLFRSAAELLSDTLKPEYLIQGIIEVGTTNALIGPSGAGKTFVALDMALCIATGKPWNGHEVKKPGPVLILAGEGRIGMRRRIKAWCTHHNIETEQIQNIFISEHIIPLNGQENNVDAIVKEVEMSGIKPAWVLIDTLARHMEGDENSTRDMSAFINQIDNLCDRLHCSVQIVHHTGYNNNDRGRGSSALKAALDSEILCNKNSLCWTKQKDGLTPSPLDFKLVDVVVYDNDDGDAPIISAVLEYAGHTAAQKSDQLTSYEKMALDALHGIASSQDNELRFIDEREWRQAFFGMRRTEKPNVQDNTLLKSWSRVCDALISKKAVEITSQGAKLLDHAESQHTASDMTF